MSDRQQVTYTTGSVTHYAFCEVCGMPCFTDEQVRVDCEVRVGKQTWVMHRHVICVEIDGDQAT